MGNKDAAAAMLSVKGGAGLTPELDSALLSTLEPDGECIAFNLNLGF